MSWTELLDGTREMMKQFRCDDPRIAQLEKNMLATFAARQSGASR